MNTLVKGYFADSNIPSIIKKTLMTLDPDRYRGDITYKRGSKR
jgi:hypothetical protein